MVIMRQVNLYSYLPDFMHDYKELKVVLNIENEYLTKQWKEIKRAFDNTFIFTTDIEGIRIFEKMIGIEVPKGLTLAERQRNVYLKWNENTRYTWKWLIKYIDIYYSGTKTKGTPVLYNNEYRLDIRLKSAINFNNYDYELFKDLRVKIPANLGLRMVAVIPATKESKYMKSSVIYKLKRTLKEIPINKISIGYYNAKTGIIYKLKKGEMINV